MTVQEAISCLKADKEYLKDQNVCDVEEIDVAIEVLEKQIPKKPVIDLNKSLRDRCPSCGNVVFTLYEDETKFPHCQWCGQKLGWEE